MDDLVTRTIFISLGVLILGFVGYMNWHGDIKHNSVQWIGKNISKPLFGDEKILSEGIFMDITVCLLAAGILLIVFSFP